MGYGAYLLPDGREAGYLVEAFCDKAGCVTKIDRGLGYLCGQNPEGWRDAGEPGCGNYYCEAHRYGDHDCTNPTCEAFAAEGNSCCGLVKGHDLPHQDQFNGTKFTETEDDLELAGESIEVITLGEDGEYWLVTGTTDAHSADVAVREHDRGETGEELEDDLGFEYRRDLVWRHGGLKPSRFDDDELLTIEKHFERYAHEAARVFPFAGFLVTL